MPESMRPAPPARRRRWLRFVLVLAVLIAAGYGYLVWQDPAPAPATGRSGMRALMMAGSTPVRVQPAVLRQMDYSLDAIGTVTALNTVTVRSRVDGELQDVLFADGEYVEKGQVLARIDARNYQIQLDQAQGQLAQTHALLRNAEQDLQRYQQLFRQQSLARQQLDAQTALVEQYRAQLQSSQAAVDQARLQLEYTDIVAPVTGRLGLRQVDPGNLITTGSAEGLVTITQVQPIAVRFSIPQTDLPDVTAAMREGRRLPVEIYGPDGITLLDQGELDAVDNQIDVATGTVGLKAVVPNAADILFPNQFVNARLVVASEPALAIPAVAVQYGSIGAFVYAVAADDTVSIRPIVPGRPDGRYIGVQAGLSVDERVVTEGVDRLRDGSKVDIIEDDEGPQADGQASPGQPGDAGSGS